MNFTDHGFQKVNLRLRYCLIFLLIFSVSCQRENKNAFSDEALVQKVFDLDMKTSDIATVLNKYKGKKVMIEVWASWCADCIKSLPDVAAFQRANPEIQFIFLSVDENEENWKAGVLRHMDNYNIKGEQYFFNTGWTRNSDNDFIDFADVNWIPRFILVNEVGKIDVFDCRKITDKQISEKL